MRLPSGDAPHATCVAFLANLSGTHRAALRPRRAHVASQPAGPPPATPDAPPDPAVASEQRVLLVRALEALPADDRLAVQLYIVDEMPAEQVARVLGYPNVKTVYNRVYRALGAIRSHLAQAGIRGPDL